MRLFLRFSNTVLFSKAKFMCLQNKVGINLFEKLKTFFLELEILSFSHCCFPIVSKDAS
eukprot:03455.XXX_71441_71614_1 [CDS] Oithona nana genome sequencing.